MKNAFFAATAVVFLATAAQAQPPAKEKDKGATPAAPAAAPAKDKGATPAAPANDKAAAPAAPATPPPPPTMTPEGKKLLESMIGNWKMKDAMFKMGDQEMKGTFTMKCTKAALGWATECKGTSDLGKQMPKTEGLYIFGWDVAAGEGHMFEIESGGNVHNHVGKWIDDKSIALTHMGKNLEGKVESDTVTFTWVSPKEMSFKAEGKQGDATAWTLTGTCKK